MVNLSAWDDAARRRLVAHARKFGRQEDLAAAAGLPKPTLQKLLSGSAEPKISTLLAVTNALGISLDTILNGANELTTMQDYEVFVAAPVAIPMHDVAFSAGPGAEALLAGDGDASAVFPEAWLREQFGKVDDLRLVRASGDSMEPTITDGQWVMIDVARKTGDGIYAVRVANDLFIKRLQFQTTRVFAISDNPAYELFIINLEDKADRDAFQVIGRVVWTGKML
ncbi:S24 family peptidase [Blastomonas sp. CCH1-A6]|uniref:S24 family peptidase n=1 Tax=Blastomonas sp. CCH1-A6 TaxID=1768762 RepID=UPI0009EBE658